MKEDVVLIPLTPRGHPSVCPSIEFCAQCSDWNAQHSRTPDPSATGLL